MEPERHLYRRAVVATLVLSALFLLGVCVLLLGWRQGVRLAFSFPVQVAVAFAAMFALGWWAAPRWGPRCTRQPALAGLFAVGVFLVGILSGCGTSMLLYGDSDLEVWLFRPLCWLGPIGGVAAFLVGLVGCFLTRRLLGAHWPA